MDGGQLNSAQQESQWRAGIRQLVLHQRFQALVIALIFLNGFAIVLETYVSGNRLLFFIDKVIVWLFVIELTLKLYGLGLRRFFRDPWHVFDFIIVGSSMVFYASPFVSVLRTVRVMRLFRMIPAIPALRKIIDSLLRSIPALTGILGMAALIFSIYAIIGTTFFREVMPTYFGDFHSALFTLMQIVTFDSWASGVTRTVMEEMPWAWIYFVSFVIVGALVILNLVVAVILSYLGQEDSVQQEDRLQQILQENQALKRDLQEIKQLLKALKQD